ncbi:MAG: hypothetical protein IJS90_06700, partial [Clostridia bacterium]|nr:hypothetical protein [Clostridia bacterium]
MKSAAYCVKLILIILACGCLLTACSGFEFFSAEQLIRPPKLTGENALIQKAFELAVGKDVMLVSPISGEYRSAFVQFDIDGDSFEENLVFYTTVDSPNEAHIHFLKYDGENWFSFGDITGNGSDVYDVRFFDLDRNGSHEIAVRWAVADSQKNKTLSLYKLAASGSGTGKETEVLTLSVIPMYDYIVDDFDLDGQNELLYSTSNSSDQEQPFRISLIKLNPDNASFEFVCEVQLSSSVTAPVNYISDTDGGVYRLFIDCQNYDGSYMTEILYYDKENSVLSRMQSEEGANLTDSTIRSSGLLSRDVNNDKKIEIPVERKYKGSVSIDYETGTETPMILICYSKITDNLMVPAEASYFYSPDNSFRFKMEDFTETYIAVYDINGSQLRFFMPDNVSTPVFTVNYVEAADANGKSEFRVRIYDAENEDLNE